MASAKALELADDPQVGHPLSWAAGRLGYSYSTVNRLVARGEIEAVKLPSAPRRNGRGSPGRIFVTAAAIEDFRRRNAVKPKAAEEPAPAETA